MSRIDHIRIYCEENQKKINALFTCWLNKAVLTNA